jgi:threonine/homoserine efflux transporter RhtA
MFRDPFARPNKQGVPVKRKSWRPREFLAGVRRHLEPLSSDLRAADKKVLMMVTAANAAGLANGYILVLVGVTKNVGPMTASCVAVLFGTPVFWFFFRPTLRSRWDVWKPSILLGLAMGANNLAYQYVLRWVQLQLLQPLSFLFSAIFMVGPDAVRDVRNGRYSTVMWPVLGVLGIWALATDTVGGAGGGAFTDAIPHVHVLGLPVPVWALGLGSLIITAASYAFHNRRTEEYSKDAGGKINTLAGIPAFAVLGVGAWALEGGWSGMTGGGWPYLLICAGSGFFLALLSGVVMVKAYGRGLRASTTAMLLPLRTLLGTFLGMVVARTAPGPLGWVAIGLILVASCGAAVIQSRQADSA